MKKENVNERAVKFILTSKDNELSGLRLEKVASAIGTRSFYLYFIFMIYHKMSFYNFVKREIIHRAVFELGKKSAVPVNDLANRLGFSTLESFEKEFESYCCVKPGIFKKCRSKINDTSNNKNRKEPAALISGVALQC